MNEPPADGPALDRADWTLLLQRGVYIEIPDTITVSGFICRLFQITPDVLKKDIRTIMVNNQIVDKPEEIELEGGETLVLSGAMPGLVGAMFRSDSPFKAMRETVTAKRMSDGKEGCSSRIRLKLLNTVLKKYRDRIQHYGDSSAIEGDE